MTPPELAHSEAVPCSRNLLTCLFSAIFFHNVIWRFLQLFWAFRGWPLLSVDSACIHTKAHSTVFRHQTGLPTRGGRSASHMTDPIAYRGSPRPDTFFDSPSTSDDEERSMSRSIPSSPPLPPPIPQRRRSPTRKKRFNLGPVGSHRITVRDESAHSLHDYPGFLALTSSPGMETSSQPAETSYQRAPESEGVLTGSAAEVAMVGQPHSTGFPLSGSTRTVYRSSPRPSAMPEETKSKSDAALEDHILDVHTITLQALRGETIGSPRGSSREYLRVDPVEPSRKRSVSAPAPRKVHVVPPPIDTTYVHKPIPDDIVRTPYPFQHRKSRWSQSTPLTPGSIKSPGRESILTLSIRRHHTLLSPHLSKLAIPAQSIDIKTTSATGREKHFSSLDFDDETFFRRLRKEYAKMSGWWRFFSARTLQRITVGHSSTCTRCVQQRAQGFGNLSKDDSIRSAWGGSGSQEQGLAQGPRSPHLLMSQGLTDTFSEVKLLQNFRNPRLTGKGRYAWVHWAHRLAATDGMLVTPLNSNSPHPSFQANPATRSPTKAETRKFDEKPTLIDVQSGGQRTDQGWPLSDSTYTSQCAAGLEFVEGWSYIRIGFALAMVLVLALAAMFLWVFLGLGGLPNTGFRDAAGRTGTAVLLGSFMLLVGWTSVLGWLAVSWLVV